MTCEHGFAHRHSCPKCNLQRKAVRDRAESFTCFSRNGRWGTCGGCPRTLAGDVFPEFCEATNRYDHQLDIDALAFQWKAACGIRPVTAATPVEDHLKLWAHVVAVHANCVPPGVRLEELLEYHYNEHHGPGGIRNHPEASRDFDIVKLVEVLGEFDEVVETRTKKTLLAPSRINVRHELGREHWNCGLGRVRIDLPPVFRGMSLDLSFDEAYAFAVELTANADKARLAERVHADREAPAVVDDDPYEGSFREAADNEGARIAAASRDSESDE